MPFADINGLKIYYEMHGDGDTIVLLHHGFGCTKMWKDIYPAFVDKGYRILMYDRRGYGQSEKGPDFQAFYESDSFRPESVAVLDLLRDVFDVVAPHVAIITETNVPHEDNITYFGDGSDEAQMVYNFALPPLLLHTFQTGNAEILSTWGNGNVLSFSHRMKEGHQFATTA